MKLKHCFLIPLLIGVALTIAFIVPAFVNLSRKPVSQKVFGENIQYERLERYENGFIIAGRDNTVRATDADGMEKWRDSDLGNLAVSMQVFGDSVFVASGNKVYSYKTDSGERALCCEKYLKDGNPIPFANITAISVSGDADMIAVSHGSSKSKHNLTVISLSSGETVFSVSVGVTADAVLFSDDGILLGLDSGNIRLYSLNGEYETIVRLSDDIQDFYREGDTLYAACSGGDLAAVDLKDKQITRSCDLAAKNPLVTPSRIIVANGGVFVACKQGSVYAFDKNLSLKNTVGVSGSVSGLCSGGENIYFSVDGTGVFLNRTDELLRSSYRLFVIFISLAVASAVFSLAVFLLAFPKVKSGATNFGKKLWRFRTPYLMLLPIFGLLFVFGFYPVFVAATRAFTDWSSTSAKINFVGFDNFRMMISEGYFLVGIKNLLIFLASYMVKILTMPLFVAVMVYSLTSGKSKFVYRYLYVLPMVVPGVVSALMWKNIYDPNFGLLNEVLDALNLGQYKTSWLSDPKTAIASLIFVGFPFIDPFSFLIYYSAMMNIPTSTIEAAQLDGASPARRFLSIILPMIASQIKILIMLGFINQIQDFNLILLLTQGGPGTMTYVPGYELYLNATSFGRYGYACALGLVMFVFIFAGTLLMNRIKVNKDMEG